MFTLYPVADALYRSLHQVIVILPTAPFVGLANYREVVTGHDFWEAVRNTTAFAAVTARSPSSPASASRGCCSPPRPRARPRRGDPALGAARRDLRRDLDLGVPPVVGHAEPVPLRDRADRALHPLADRPAARALSVVVAFVWTQFPFAAICSWRR